MPAYIAEYLINKEGTDLIEKILFQDKYWSQFLRDKWEELVQKREPNWRKAPMLQGWYCDKNEVTCMARTNQPFKLK